MTKRSVLVQDDRMIRALYSPAPGSSGGWCVGHQGVTKIEPYDELGESGPVPWLAIYEGDAIVCRMPASLISIVYGGFPP